MHGLKKLLLTQSKVAICTYYYFEERYIIMERCANWHARVFKLMHYACDPIEYIKGNHTVLFTLYIRLRL